MFLVLMLLSALVEKVFVFRILIFFYFCFTFQLSMMLTAQTNIFSVFLMHIWRTSVARLSYKQPCCTLIHSLKLSIKPLHHFTPYCPICPTRFRVLKKKRFSFSNMCHISHAACHVACVICHMSNVTCRMSHVICKPKNQNKIKKGDKVSQMVCHQQDYPV